MFRAAHSIFRAVTQSPSESLNIATRCAPAVAFYLAPLRRGVWEAQPLDWAPKEQDLPADGSMVAWGRGTFAHTVIISIPAVPEIIPPENKDNHIY